MSFADPAWNVEHSSQPDSNFARCRSFGGKQTPALESQRRRKTRSSWNSTTSASVRCPRGATARSDTWLKAAVAQSSRPRQAKPRIWASRQSHRSKARSRTGSHRFAGCPCSGGRGHIRSVDDEGRPAKGDQEEARRAGCLPKQRLVKLGTYWQERLLPPGQRVSASRQRVAVSLWGVYSVGRLCQPACAWRAAVYMCR